MFWWYFAIIHITLFIFPYQMYLQILASKNQMWNIRETQYETICLICDIKRNSGDVMFVLWLLWFLENFDLNFFQGFHRIRSFHLEIKIVLVIVVESFWINLVCLVCFSVVDYSYGSIFCGKFGILFWLDVGGKVSLCGFLNGISTHWSRLIKRSIEKVWFENISIWLLGQTKGGDMCILGKLFFGHLGGINWDLEASVAYQTILICKTNIIWKIIFIHYCYS